MEEIVDGLHDKGMTDEVIAINAIDLTMKNFPKLEFIAIVRHRESGESSIVGNSCPLCMNEILEQWISDNHIQHLDTKPVNVH